MATPKSLPTLDAWLGRLDRAMAAEAGRYPSRPAGGQPIHTYYLPGDRFAPAAISSIADQARDLVRRHADGPEAFGAAMHVAGDLAEEVYERSIARIDTTPIQDLRLDFEDGYGYPDDRQEDHDVARAAIALAGSRMEPHVPQQVGIRIKPLTAQLAPRSLRSLDVFLTSLATATDGELPAMVITLPKVTAVEQAAVFSEALQAAEESLDLPAGRVAAEIMIESAHAVIDHEGRVPIRRFVEALGSRCTGVHFGTYDYTASCGIVAAHQHLLHTSCVFAREVMRVALAGSGVWLSDGGTNVLPAPDDDGSAVHRGWSTHAAHVHRALADGFYQGWDVHPGQLPARFAATIAFFLEGLDEAATRMASIVGDGAGSAGVADEPATTQALLDYLIRAVDAGAADRAEMLARTGLTEDELDTGRIATR